VDFLIENFFSRQNMCQKCHATEMVQFNQCRHGLPAYVTCAGSKDLAPDVLEMYEAIPEGSSAPDKSRNAIHMLEDPDLTRFTCEDCHNIGAIGFIALLDPAENNASESALE
jgi:hypothetical protein